MFKTQGKSDKDLRTKAPELVPLFIGYLTIKFTLSKE